MYRIQASGLANVGLDVQGIDEMRGRATPSQAVHVGKGFVGWRPQRRAQSSDLHQSCLGRWRSCAWVFGYIAPQRQGCMLG